MAASVWRGRITFGLVSIPVRLVKAARRERARFRRVQRMPAEPPEVQKEEDSWEERPRVVAFPGGMKAVGLQQAPDRVPGPVIQRESGPDQEAVVRVRNPPQERALKGYEIAKGEFVVLEPEEVAALRPRTSQELEITEF